MKKKLFITLLLSGLVLPVFAATLTVPMKIISGKNAGTSIGTVTFVDGPYGLVINPQLKDLPPGLHGFHVHQNPSCADQGMAAGGHDDPQKTGKHLGPYNSKGHLGDLPVLYVASDGTATLPMVAPRLTTKELQHHALMIHLNGDNYSDTPEKLGGGGARLACGVIP